MKKPTLESALARKAPSEPGSALLTADKPAKKALDDGKMTTSLRIRPEMLAELKLLALQRRVRVNDVILEAIGNHLALNGRRAAA